MKTETKNRMLKYIIVMSSCLLAGGCVGSPVHKTLTRDRKMSEIRRNHENLLLLKVGMDKSQVTEVMGKPNWTEGGKWGSAWMYRTAMSEIYSEADEDFTPVVFGLDGKVIGWGHNFYANHKQKHEEAAP